MEIGASSNNYADILQDITASQAREIKKAAIMEQLGLKVAMAANIAEEAMTGLSGGYEPDSVIPENSTISYHV